MLKCQPQVPQNVIMSGDREASLRPSQRRVYVGLIQANTCWEKHCGIIAIVAIHQYQPNHHSFHFLLFVNFFDFWTTNMFKTPAVL